MKSISIIKGIMILVLLGMINSARAQEYYDLNYDCLQEALEISEVHELNYRVICREGVLSTDTTETPCSKGFYSQDYTNIKAHYYKSISDDGGIEFAFGAINLRNDGAFEREELKYFELNQSTLWYYLTSHENEVNRLSVRLNDLSGQGINFGTRLQQGGLFYENLEALNEAEIEGVQVAYENYVLTVEGNLERLFIGGDHLLVSHVEYNAVTTTVDELSTEELRVYPQPVNDRITVELPNDQFGEIVLMDLYGRTILSDQFDGGTWTKNVAFLPTGTFILQIRQEDKLIGNQRFIKH